MKQVLNGILSLGFGLGFAIFHRRLAKEAVTFYERLQWPHISETGLRIAFLLTGVVFAVVGVLALFQIIRFR